MTPRTTAVAAVLGAPVLGALAVVLARLGGFELAWSIGALIGVSTTALVLLGLWLPTVDPVPPPPAPEPPPSPSTSFGDLAALRLRVESDGTDPQRFETRLRPRLSALATERLWQQHGIDWRTEDGRTAAATMLGPGITALLTAPPGTLRLTPESLISWIRELEVL